VVHGRATVALAADGRGRAAFIQPGVRGRAAAPRIAPGDASSLPSEAKGADIASDQEFVDFVLDQFAEDCRMRARPMFGEYGVYSHDVFIGMVCANRLFFKKTEAGGALLGDTELAPPYPGATPIFVMSEDQLEDPDLLSELARATRAGLAG
jgi:TfoX/Sxy family transcriptional regulator of competence genes